MAQYADRKRYGSGAVFGSLAYDFNKPEVFSEPAYEEVPLAAPPRTEERAVAGTAAMPRQALAPFAVVGFLVAAALLVFMLLAQVRLTEISNEAVTMQSRLEEQRLEETRLRIAYESAFNFAEIEEYAVASLGMQKPRGDQVFYVYGAAPDRAVVLTGDGEESGLASRIGDLLASIAEYFE